VSQTAAHLGAEAAQKLVKALQDVGIDRKDIQTSPVHLTPLSTDPNTNAVGRTDLINIESYRAFTRVRVTLRDLTKLSDVLSVAVAAGATWLESMTFGKEGQADAEEEALAKATADARRKAERIARAA